MELAKVGNADPPSLLPSIRRGSQSKEDPARTATTPQKNRFGIFTDQSDSQPPDAPAAQPASMGGDRNRGATRSIPGRSGSRGPSADSERQRALQVIKELIIIR